MPNIQLVYATPDGTLRFDPELQALAAGEECWELTPDDLMPLPPGAILFSLPDRQPLGLEEATGEVAMVDEPGLTAVAAILPQGYTRTLLPAYQSRPGAPPLPLFGYTAVAAIDEELYVAARQTDEEEKWNPLFYNTPDLPGLIQKKLAAYPKNRLLRQLAKCAQEYQCFTAQNIFYHRWEGGVPVSPACNAECLGCISKQPAECCPSPQGRLTFRPSVAEVVEVALPHLSGADAIISFGQGCEGEPLLAGEVIRETITALRRQTGDGTININTNAGRPEMLAALADAGLNSARISLFSAAPEAYRLYHRPQGFSLEQVGASIDRLRQGAVFVALNLLVIPGFTDLKPQMEQLFAFLAAHPVHMIQLRNLNIDPELLWGSLKKGGLDLSGELVGISTFLAELKKRLPEVVVGNYSRAVQKDDN